MSKDNIDISWSKIYNIWENTILYSFNELQQPIKFSKIPIEKCKLNNDYYIKGYDWILNTEYDAKIEYVVNKTNEWLYFGSSINKGTITTAQYLAEAFDKKELVAAILIYTCTHELYERLPDKWRGKSAKLLHSVNSEAFLYLREKDYTWHHAMKKLIPDLFLSYDFLEHINLDTADILIELIAVISSLILKFYSIAYYYTIGVE